MTLPLARTSLPTTLNEKMVSLSEDKTSEEAQVAKEDPEEMGDSRKRASSGQASPLRKVSKPNDGTPILIQQVRVALHKLSSPAVVHLGSDTTIKQPSDSANPATSYDKDDEVQIMRSTPTGKKSSLEKSKITQYLPQRKDGVKPVSKVCDHEGPSPLEASELQSKTDSNDSINFSTMELPHKINNNIESNRDPAYSKTSDLKVILSDVFGRGKKISDASSNMLYISHSKQSILTPGEDIGDMNDSPKSKDDSVSVVSSATSSISSASSCSSYDHLFEIPKSTARFPSSKGSVGGCLVGTRSISYSTQGSEEPASVVICKWELCGQEFDNNSKLLEHLRSVHAKNPISGKQDPQMSEEKDHRTFKCLWEGCKVYGKGSSSESWLEKHVITNHGGSKPFQCIVDGCKQRFGTQTLLERHVNNHFKATSASNSANSKFHSQNHCQQSKNSKRSSLTNNLMPPCGGKTEHVKGLRTLISVKGKRFKFKKRPLTNRMFDLFDMGVMAQVRQQITKLETNVNELKHRGNLEFCESRNPSDQIFVFKSHVVAKKTDVSGNVMCLVSWNPPDILEEEWCLASEVQYEKRLKMADLNLNSRLKLSSRLQGGLRIPKPS